MYIDTRLKKCIIQGKGSAIVTRKNINKGEILIEDIPYVIKEKKFKSDMFCMLYEILNDHINIIQKFLNLYPKSLNDYLMDDSIKNNINSTFKSLKKIDITKYNFFKKYTREQIYLYCAKYICNGFNYYNRSAFLFTGTLLNHSCIPNVIFGEKDGKMVFIAARDIQMNEEICDNYIDISLSHKKRKHILKYRYGFVCNCQRCKSNDSQYNDEVSEIKKYKDSIFKS